MNDRLIKNFDELSTTPNRKIALEVIEAGFGAIKTNLVVQSSLSLDGDILSIKGQKFDLKKIKRMRVVGFGKSSCEAAQALENILGDRIEKGAVIDLSRVSSGRIEFFAGSHPKPSRVNIEAGNKICELLNGLHEDDLVIVLVSGGGSALLCYPESECKEGVKLYDGFLKSGKTIAEINTVRKHLSLLKGGGLVKIAYPATIIGLIFSDIPGNNFQNVASGPTYKDETTVDDAMKIIKENNLGEFDLIETPKEDKYFENVHNFVLVSNKTAIEKMAEKAKDYGLEASVASTDLYDKTDKVLEKIFSLKKNNSVILAAGEPSIAVIKGEGKGGRNLHLGLQAISQGLIDQDSVFISFASDGMDNSDVAGAIVDKETIKKAEKLHLNAGDYLERFNSYEFFQKTGDAIITGPTGSNVSDLMILLNKK